MDEHIEVKSLSHAISKAFSLGDDDKAAGRDSGLIMAITCAMMLNKTSMQFDLLDICSASQKETVIDCVIALDCPALRKAGFLSAMDGNIIVYDDIWVDGSLGVRAQSLLDAPFILALVVNRESRTGIVAIEIFQEPQ